MATRKHSEIETDFIEPIKVKIPTPQRVAVSKNGMVATAHYHATQSGVRFNENAGNSDVAAVSEAFALGVCEPQDSGVGGLTMMLIHLSGEIRTFSIDGSSRVPNRAM